MNSKQLIEIMPAMQAGVKGHIVVDKRQRCVYFTAEQLPEPRAQKWLMWQLMVSGILVTPYWLFDKFMPLPHFIVHSPLLWFIVLFITLGLPVITWYFGRQKQQYQLENLKPLTLEDFEIDNALNRWWAERLWVAFVLLLLPPTVLLFLVLYISKADVLDALLITIHIALLMRRLVPHAVARIMISKQQIKEWQNESRLTTSQVSTGQDFG